MDQRKREKMKKKKNIKEKIIVEVMREEKG